MPARKMTDEVFEKVCKAIETTWKGVNSLCLEFDSSASSFYDYKNATPEATERYARARERQLDYLEELLQELVFQEKRDKEVVGTINLGANAINRDRLKADTLKFILSKLRPSKYGNRLEVNMTAEPRVFKID
jgi:hypothetical protein